MVVHGIASSPDTELFGRIMCWIRRSQNLSEVLAATVEEVGQFLNCDRVKIYQFLPDETGRVVVMPTAGQKDFTVWFRRPCQRIRTWLTGARQIRLTALDINQRVLAQDCQGNAVFVQPPDNAAIVPFPQHQITLDATNIACIRVSSEAPFVMDGFACE